MGELDPQLRRLLLACLAALGFLLLLHLALFRPGLQRLAGHNKDLARLLPQKNRFFPNLEGRNSDTLPVYGDYKGQIEERQKSFREDLRRLQELLLPFRREEPSANLEEASRFVDRLESTRDDARRRLAEHGVRWDLQEDQEHELDVFGFPKMSPELAELPDLEINLLVLREAIDALELAADPAQGGGRIRSLNVLRRGPLKPEGIVRRQFLMLAGAEIEFTGDIRACRRLLAALERPGKFFALQRLQVFSAGERDSSAIRVSLTLAKIFYLPEEIRQKRTLDVRDPSIYHYYRGT